MSIYVLVHGGWHGAWCWHNIVPLLQRKGHKVIVPDLPGHGIDRTPISAGTLRSYTNHINQILKKQNEPVILIGHSMSGAVITQAAEECSAAIQKLIYLTAFLLPNGTSIVQHVQIDSQSRLPSIMDTDEANGIVSIHPAKAREVFYQDCPESDIALAEVLLTPEPFEIGPAVVHTSDRFANIPRFYIECLNDQAMSLELQRYMYNKLPCEHVFSLPTSHAPFFSAPDSLAEILTSVA